MSQKKNKYCIDSILQTTTMYKNTSLIRVLDKRYLFDMRIEHSLKTYTIPLKAGKLLQSHGLFERKFLQFIIVYKNAAFPDSTNP